MGEERDGVRGGIIGSIIVLFLAAVFTTWWEVNASRAKEAYSIKATLYRDMVDQLGRLEGVANELRWNVSAWEAGQDSLSDILGRDYMRSAREIQDQLRRLPIPPDAAGGESPATVATQRSWAELEALQVCVQNRLQIRDSDVRTHKTENIAAGVNEMAEEGLLSKAQADSILADAAIASPCAGNYSPAAIQELKMAIAASGWKHLKGSWLTQLLSGF